MLLDQARQGNCFGEIENGVHRGWIWQCSEDNPGIKSNILPAIADSLTFPFQCSGVKVMLCLFLFKTCWCGGAQMIRKMVPWLNIRAQHSQHQLDQFQQIISLSSSQSQSWPATPFGINVCFCQVGETGFSIFCKHQKTPRWQRGGGQSLLARSLSTKMVAPSFSSSSSSLLPCVRLGTKWARCSGRGMVWPLVTTGIFPALTDIQSLALMKPAPTTFRSLTPIA